MKAKPTNLAAAIPRLARKAAMMARWLPSVMVQETIPVRPLGAPLVALVLTPVAPGW